VLTSPAGTAVPSPPVSSQTPQPASPAASPPAGAAAPGPTPAPSERPSAAPSAAATPPPRSLSAPTLTTPIGEPTGQTRLALTGTATAGTTLRVLADGAELARTAVGADGRWQATADLSHLPEGISRLVLESSLPGSAPGTTAVVIRIDRQVAIPTRLASRDTAEGVVVSGVADPGSTVTVRGPGTRASAVADGDGNWSTPSLTTLPAGYSSVTASAEDEAGNVSAPSAPLGVTVG